MMILSADARRSAVEVLREFAAAAGMPTDARYTRGATWEEGNQGDGLSLAGFRDTEPSSGTRWLRRRGEFGFEDQGMIPYHVRNAATESARVTAYHATPAGKAARARAYAKVKVARAAGKAVTT